MEPELKKFGGKEASLDRSEESSPCSGAGADDAATENAHPLLRSDSSVSDGSGAVKPPPECIEGLEKKCAAFVRRDAYGTMRRGKLPLEEKLLLAFALVTLVPIRLVIGVAMLVFCYIVCRVCTLFKDPNQGDEQEGDYVHMVGWRRELVVRLGRFLSRLLLFTMGFYWIPETCHEEGEPWCNGKMMGTSEDLIRPGSTEDEIVMHFGLGIKRKMKVLFWRYHRKSFRSPSKQALTVHDALSRRHNYKWRFSPPIQDGCLSSKGPSTSSDSKISLSET